MRASNNSDRTFGAAGRLVAIALCLGAITGNAGVAGAQPAAKQTMSASQQVEAGVMKEFARCFIDRRRRTVGEIMALPYLSDEQAALVNRVVGREEYCMAPFSGPLDFRAPAVAGALAEQLILDRYAKADLTTLAGLTEESAMERLKPRNGAEDFGLCVARQDPSSIRSLVGTMQGSKEEAAYIKKLMPYFGPCLSTGQNLSMNRGTIRSLLAVGLYRSLSVLATTRSAARS